MNQPCTSKTTARFQYLKMILENVNTKVGELVGFDRTTQNKAVSKIDNRGDMYKPYDSEY